ncbi:MAG: glutamate racemase [Oscillospiraceae bacterium]|nr:glutamate racemase [Oscillospiraceae bacterium]
MYTKESPIAVFDSGVGGISVLRELVQLMPNENYLYFGDSANAPYGDKTTQQVRELTMEAAQMLVARNIKALVVACNTATAAAITLLRQQYPELIVIGIEPALKLAADRFPQGRVGVMATQVTLREEKFAHQAERFPEVTIELIPAPGLVELIEAGQEDSLDTRNLLEKLLLPYVGKLDALVLGCTHYPFVKKQIARILGDSTQLLDGGEGTARQTRRCLEKQDLLNPGPGSVQMENSSHDAALLERGMQLLNREVAV